MFRNYLAAALRNLAITLLHRQGRTSMTAARRFFATAPDQALALLVAPPTLRR